MRDKNMWFVEAIVWYLLPLFVVSWLVEKHNVPNAVLTLVISFMGIQAGVVMLFEVFTWAIRKGKGNEQSRHNA